jgi:predicted O-methyltransferase YrrM
MMNESVSDNHATIHPAILEFERNYDRTKGGWREDGVVRFANVELEVGRLWHTLVLLLQPRSVLETGTFRGYSTACIASALVSLGNPDRRVITIDPEPKEDQVWAGTNLESFISLRRQMSQEAFGELFLLKTRFDMLVLDSDHHYDTIMSELMLYEPLLNVNGTILLHDSLFFDGVGAATRQLLANPRFQGLTLDTPRREYPGHRCPGVTIVRKDREGDPGLYLDRRYSGWGVGDAFAPPLLRGA